MADRLDDFDFTPKEPRRTPPPFPLDDWLDGSIWRIWQGEDFDIDRRSMRAGLHRYARHRDLRVVTRYVESGGRLGIVFRAADSRAELDAHGH